MGPKWLVGHPMFYLIIVTMTLMSTQFIQKIKISRSRRSENLRKKMFSSKFLHLTKNPNQLVSMARRFKCSGCYEMNEPVDKCVSYVQNSENRCVKKEGLHCRSPNPSIKCVNVSPQRICTKIAAPMQSFSEMLLAYNQHIRAPCLNECCCLEPSDPDYVHKVH
ncbi:hypothetical protein HA402_005893 [Bradysia odoriphaga]|nr:hypothetical protein HA402_005893 [Bradysia odoriphaga]